MQSSRRGALRVAVFIALLLAVSSAPMVSAASSAAQRPKVALVLGGGAARGFSHVGLLRAFEEEGIPFDMIVAASMGSVLTGLYASGFTPAELEYMAQRLDLAELFYVTLPPRGGVVRTERLEGFLHEVTGGARLESLRVPYYPVVTNLFTGESVVLREGAQSRAIVASMSIPGMFPPVDIDGETYVDGGIKEPVPARFARELGADIVIAVDVRREVENPSRDSIMNNLQLTLYFLLDQNTELHLPYADYLISPGVHYDTYMDYQRVAYFIDRGYRAAKAAIPEIKALLAEKIPGITFEPRYDPAVDAEKLDALVARGLDAVRPAPASTLKLHSTWTWEQGADPRLDLEARVPLVRVGRGGVVGGFELVRRAGEEELRAVELGVAAGAGGAFAFARKGAGDEAWRPGVRLEFERKLLLATSGGDAFEAEWEWLDPDDPWAQWRISATSLRPLGGPPSRSGSIAQVRQGEFAVAAGRDARGLYGPEGPYLDVKGRLYFPLQRGVLSELAIANTALFAGLGARVEADQGQALASWSGEAGVRFEMRFFGLYPVRSRLSFTYDTGPGRWAVALSLGE